QRDGSPNRSRSCSCSSGWYDRRAGSRRTWQRRATVWMPSSASALVTRTDKASSGATANGTASAFSTWKLRSGMRSLLQLGEKLADLLPHLGAAGQASPVRANEPHQLVALI